MTSGNRTTGNSMKATDGTASAIQVTYNISGGLLGGVQATNSNMYGTHTIGTGGLNMWKQAYAMALAEAGWSPMEVRSWENFQRKVADHRPFVLKRFNYDLKRTKDNEPPFRWENKK